MDVSWKTRQRIVGTPCFDVREMPEHDYPLDTAVYGFSIVEMSFKKRLNSQNNFCF